MRNALLALAFASLAGTALARGDIAILARTCNNCHGVDGVSAGASMPSIGGLPKEYLGKVMRQWKYDERTGVTMPRIVKGFSDDEIDALAAHFAAQRWVPVPQAAPPDLLAKGKATVSDNCEDCHGTAGDDPDVDAPQLNGQWAKYMELEIEKYRSGEFKMPHRKMKKAVNAASPADAAAAARHFGAQGK